MRAEVIEHRAAVMRDQNAAFQRHVVQKLRIAYAIKTGLLGGNEIYRRLSPPYGLYDSELKVVVCLKANAQQRRSP